MLSLKTNTDIRARFLGHVTPQENPTLFATCGIPGAGKSTFVDQKITAGDFPSNAYILNPDRVMVAMDEFQTDMAGVDAQSAYLKWEMPARDLAYQMADEAGSLRAHIIKDMGCANPLSLELVKRLKGEGYRVVMHHIDCNIDEAFRRIDARDFRISRDEVQARLDVLNGFIPEYRAIADVFYHYDNTDLNAPFQIAA